jgi:hypothetical protein
MKDLNYDLKKLCHRYREGSFATYADRERILDLIANQLQDLGFKALRAMTSSHGTSMRWLRTGTKKASARAPSRNGMDAPRLRELNTSHRQRRSLIVTKGSHVAL